MSTKKDILGIHRHKTITNAPAGLIRSFLLRSYPTMKHHNPHTPIMIREALNTQPRVFARYEFGREKVEELGGKEHPRKNPRGRKGGSIVLHCIACDGDVGRRSGRKPEANKHSRSGRQGDRGQDHYSGQGGCEVEVRGWIYVFWRIKSRQGNEASRHLHKRGMGRVHTCTISGPSPEEGKRSALINKKKEQ